MRKLLLAAPLSVVIFFAVALILILSQSPRGAVEGTTLTFPPSDRVVVTSELLSFVARDGTRLGYREVPGGGAGTLVLIHGSGWHGATYEPLARALAAMSGFRVILPDLRGHGPLADPRGDVAYIGQMEDDLADLLDHLWLERAVFVGHSSGGGLVVRLAGGPHAARMSRAVLIAPFLKYNAPTAREDSGWAHPLTRRIVGLSMLNAAGINGLNELTAIEFNIPEAVRATDQGQFATAAYSYRLNTGFAPRANYEADIAALPPFLLLAGAEDEVFRAQEYEPLMSAITDKGRYEILPGRGHLGVLDAAATAEIIAAFLREP